MLFSAQNICQIRVDIKICQKHSLYLHLRHTWALFLKKHGFLLFLNTLRYLNTNNFNLLIKILLSFASNFGLENKLGIAYSYSIV